MKPTKRSVPIALGCGGLFVEWTAACAVGAQLRGRLMGPHWPRCRTHSVQFVHFAWQAVAERCRRKKQQKGRSVQCSSTPTVGERPTVGVASSTPSHVATRGLRFAQEGSAAAAVPCPPVTATRVTSSGQRKPHALPTSPPTVAHAEHSRCGGLGGGDTAASMGNCCVEGVATFFTART